MTQPIQRVPAGLLSFLGLRGQGVNPRELADQVLGVLNLEHLYVAPDLISTTVTSPAVAAVTALDMSVPAGEAWRIIAIGIVIHPSAAAAVMNVSLGITAPGGQTTPISVPYRRVATDATERLDYGVLIPQPFVAMPGTIFSGIVEEAPGGATTLAATLRVTYHRLKV